MQGVKPEWANLRRKRCRNCPDIFKPSQPTQVFCSANCRKEFDRYGGAYARLKSVVIEEVKRQVRKSHPAEETRIAGIEQRVSELEARLGSLRQALGTNGR